MSIATIRRSRTVKATDREGSPSRIETTPGHAVDQRRPDDEAELRVRRAWTTTAARPADLRDRPAAAPAVRAQHDVRVQHRDAAPRSRRRARRPGRRRRPRAGGGRSASGTACSPWTRRRARLASWRAASGERSTIGAISSNGTANMSCSTKASRSAGVSVSRTTSRARPDRVGQQRLVLRVGAVGPVHDRIGQVHVERLLAAHLARAQGQHQAVEGVVPAFGA